MADYAIEARNIVKRYERRKTVLDGVSFSVRKGELVAIYGKSGCGKTTLLNIVGGLDRPNSGEIAIDGENIVDMSEDQLADLRLRKIGFVFQDFNLLMDMTVRQNIALPLRFSGRKDGRIVDKLLTKFGIQEIADEMANEISGGEAQRTALARALVNDPTIILADEPTGNLDLENTNNVMECLLTIVREFNTTVLLATHDTDLVKYSSSRILLKDGKAIQEEPSNA